MQSPGRDVQSFPCAPDVLQRPADAFMHVGPSDRGTAMLSPLACLPQKGSCVWSSEVLLLSWHCAGSSY